MLSDQNGLRKQFLSLCCSSLHSELITASPKMRHRQHDRVLSRRPAVTTSRINDKTAGYSKELGPRTRSGGLLETIRRFSRARLKLFGIRPPKPRPGRGETPQQDRPYARGSGWTGSRRRELLAWPGLTGKARQCLRRGKTAPGRPSFRPQRRFQ